MASSSKQPRPDTKEWYGIKHARVKQAEFSYRKGAGADWTHLADAKAAPNPNVSWNVDQVTISGDGIKLMQRDQDYAPPKHGKKGLLRVGEDNYRWQVVFKQGRFNQIFLREYRKPPQNPLFVELRFICTAAPDSADATLRMELTPTEDEGEDAEGSSPGKGEETEEGRIETDEDEADDGDDDEDEADENEADEEEAEEGEIDEDETGDNNVETDTSSFPLAQLFADPEVPPGLEIRLVFIRENATRRNTYKWIWPAVIHFLAGRPEWTPFGKAKDQAKNYGPANWQLDKVMASNPRQPAAIMERHTLQEGDAWQLKPKAVPTAQLPAPLTRLPVRPPQTAEPLKRKREGDVAENAPENLGPVESAGRVYDKATFERKNSENALQATQEERRRLEDQLQHIREREQDHKADVRKWQAQEEDARKEWRRQKDLVASREGAERKRR